jgi:hypothetical protein
VFVSFGVSCQPTSTQRTILFHYVNKTDSSNFLHWCKQVWLIRPKKTRMTHHPLPCILVNEYDSSTLFRNNLRSLVFSSINVNKYDASICLHWNKHGESYIFIIKVNKYDSSTLFRNNFTSFVICVYYETTYFAISRLFIFRNMYEWSGMYNLFSSIT